jgi:hypothetical protein
LHVLGTPPALILSQDQTLMLKMLATDRSAKAFALQLEESDQQHNPLTRGRFMAFALFQSVLWSRGSPPAAFARTDNSSRPILRCHALTLLSDSARLRSLRRDRVCVCLHALSSFQRTDRPVVPGTPGGSALRREAQLPPHPFCRLHRRPRLGEPSKVTRTARSRQSLNS